MAHRLLLLRHAKSDWSRALPDSRRPLNPRGQRDAELLGKWIAAHELPPPARILASPAARVRETLERLLPAAGWNAARLIWEDNLYLADAGCLLQIVHSLPNDLDRVMLAGHNPGLENLLQRLADTAVPPTDKGKIFTTANLACLEGPESWSQWGRKRAHLDCLLRPRELDMP